MNRYFLLIILTLVFGCSQRETNVQIEIIRIIDEPIIPPLLLEEIGENVQGPSLIRAPAWLKDPLGKYYLYFADHKGDRIKLAFADKLIGPWTIHPGGTLNLQDSYFLEEMPDIPENFDLEINFGNQTVSKNKTINLPNVDSLQKLQDFTNLRALADSEALKIKYTNEDIYLKNEPKGTISKSLYEIA